MLFESVREWLLASGSTGPRAFAGPLISGSGAIMPLHF
ncbi:hypothetical protein SAMN04489800_2381 [Pseudomonas deceptionensis]|uniref:Uncharacterized protein n=1 Tax=Pseudomonas deceptionensis TaxID=882211 RepID=A0A1H5M5I4_PSEDM|nr:hypothetical protein SAMN04489800_2381 [Pseudomonas deceptionensis]